MSEKRRATIPSGIGLIILILLSVGLTGCHGSMSGGKSSVVPKHVRNDLVVGGEHSGLWETNDLSVHYSYERSQNRLKLSGEVRFAPYLQKNFPYLALFNMSLLLVNAKGHVLATKPVATSNYYAGTAQPLPFSITLALPPGTAAMAFGYTGKAKDIDNQQGGGSTNFFYYPVSTLP